MQWKMRFRGATLQIIFKQDPWVYGWFTPVEGRAMLEVCEILPKGTIVETGSFCGKSTRYLLLGATLSDSKLYVVDLFTGHLQGEKENIEKVYMDLIHGDTFPIFTLNLNQCFIEEDISRLKTLKSDTIEQAKKWSYGPIDVLFVDDDHTRCRQAVEAWSPHLADHAVLALHDVGNTSLYGIDSPINTYMTLRQEGWKELYGASEHTLRILTRDPEWWYTRGEAVRDRYNAIKELRSPGSGLSERSDPYDPGPSASIGGIECDDNGNPVSSHDSNPGTSQTKS